MVRWWQSGRGNKIKEMALSPPWEHRPDASEFPKQRSELKEHCGKVARQEVCWAEGTSKKVRPRKE